MLLGFALQFMLKLFLDLEVYEAAVPAAAESVRCVALR